MNYLNPWITLASDLRAHNSRTTTWGLILNWLCRALHGRGPIPYMYLNTIYIYIYTYICRGRNPGSGNTHKGDQGHKHETQIQTYTWTCIQWYHLEGKRENDQTTNLTILITRRKGLHEHITLIQKRRPQMLLRRETLHVLKPNNTLTTAQNTLLYHNYISLRFLA